MVQRTGIRSGLGGVLSALLLLVMSTTAFAQVPPTAPATSTGSYTVSWPAQGTVALLQERIGTGGTWITVNNSLYTYAAPNYSMTYANKAGGDYFYRVYMLVAGQYGATWYTSAEIRVTVSGGVPAPTQDLVSNQLRYTYDARVGDINADGRQDVYVRRTSGGAAGNGAIYDIILRRLADGSFTPDVPTTGQSSTAAGWPLLNTPVRLADRNLDGYVDVELPNLGNALSGAIGQIIFSSGTPGVLAAQRVAPMNAKYDKFMTDMALWLKEPNYFANHADIFLVPIYGYIYRCDYRMNDWAMVWECWLDWGPVGYEVYFDFRPWDSDAVNMRYSFNQVVNGILQPSVIPGSNDAFNIGRWFTNVFGVQYLRGILGNNCYDYQYDPITGLPCINYNLLGMILLDNLKKKPDDGRPLTPGEKERVLAEGMAIRGVDEVRVFNRAYEVFWIAQDETPMAPDGNIWIGPLSWLTYRADYSLESRHEMSIFLHETVHVFQARNRGLAGFGMYAAAANAAVTGGYKYMPLTPSYSFYLRNIEQQAELIQDRYRLRPPTSLGVYRAFNQGATYDDLQAFIPGQLQ